ncbi:hypothetical protein CRENBAI_006529 [Crenichthys baileyi]|uniref:Uncharacterized protein n=1 Tax=Crenichthys baileyi TaxID=28760 RepID=A0AAV9SLH7_9TELE
MNRDDVGSAFGLVAGVGVCSELRRPVSGGKPRYHHWIHREKIVLYFGSKVHLASKLKTFTWVSSRMQPMETCGQREQEPGGRCLIVISASVIWVPLMTVSWIPCSCVFCSGELLGTTPQCSCPPLAQLKRCHTEYHTETDITENLRAAPPNSAFVGKLASSNKPSSQTTVLGPTQLGSQSEPTLFNNVLFFVFFLNILAL